MAAEGATEVLATLANNVERRTLLAVEVMRLERQACELRHQLNTTHPLLCLPSQLLPRILLDATSHDDLLVFVSACAQVCRDFRRTVLGTESYGTGLLPFRRASVPAGEYLDGIRCHRDDRSRVLREITDAMHCAREGRQGDDPVDEQALAPGELDLSNIQLGEAGCRTLAAALHAMPAPLALTDMYLDGCEITPAGVVPIAAAMQRGFAEDGLARLHIYNNPGLGDAGVVALAAALPSTLENLGLAEVGCGDAGMMALVAALPRLTALRGTNLSRNHAVGQAAWEAYAAMLPQLPCMRRLDVHSCSGMGDGGAFAIAAALEKCTLDVPGVLVIRDCRIGEEATAALQNAWGARPKAGLELFG
jgi:hypothetical protein